MQAFNCRYKEIEPRKGCFPGSIEEASWAALSLKSLYQNAFAKKKFKLLLLGYNWQNNFFLIIYLK